MTDKPPYNGWTNWATWNGAVWFSNKHHIYQQRIRTREWDSGMVSEFFSDCFPNGTPDMEQADIRDINWTEIASHWTDED